MVSQSSWSFNSVPVTHKCDFCLEHKTEAPVQVTESSSVCRDCFTSQLKPKFEAALENEQFYPVVFGNPIHPSSFPDFFTAEFINAFTEKEKEYKTPVNSRVYCGCGKFLGDASGAANGSTVVCPCGATTCTQCKTAVQQGVTHSCHQTATTGLDGLQPGQDYQICPQCHIAVELIDACNAITCRCGQTFCFVCGQTAAENSGHWRSGCPRYNRPGQANAQYDTPAQAHVDEVFHHVEQLVPDRGPIPALLAQAMDALAVDRSQPVQQPPRPVAPQPPSQEVLRERAERQRRAANDMAARMGLSGRR